MIYILNMYQVRNTSRHLVDMKADMEWIPKVINSRRYKYLMNNYRNEGSSKYYLLYTYLCSLTLFSLSSISTILCKRYIYSLGLTSKKHMWNAGGKEETSITPAVVARQMGFRLWKVSTSRDWHIFSLHLKYYIFLTPQI